MGEVAIVLTVALLLFGKRLPEVARSLGRGMSELRRGMLDLKDEFVRAENDALAAPSPPPGLPGPSPGAAPTPTSPSPSPSPTASPR